MMRSCCYPDCLNIALPTEREETAPLCKKHEEELNKLLETNKDEAINFLLLITGKRIPN